MSFFKEIEAGDFSGAFRKVASWVESDVAALQGQFPVIGQFLTQFTSDFGKKVLADAEALAPGVIAGTSSITSAAATLVSQAATAGLSIAESDATQVALNALRVYVSAPDASAAAPSAASPAA